MLLVLLRSKRCQKLLCLCLF